MSSREKVDTLRLTVEQKHAHCARVGARMLGDDDAHRCPGCRALVQACFHKVAAVHACRMLVPTDLWRSCRRMSAVGPTAAPVLDRAVQTALRLQDQACSAELRVSVPLIKSPGLPLWKGGINSIFETQCACFCSKTILCYRGAASPVRRAMLAAKNFFSRMQNSNAATTMSMTRLAPLRETISEPRGIP